MKNTILRDCLRISREKLSRHPEKDHWIHYSFVIQNNKIVEYGYNHNAEPPVFMGYNQRLSWSKAKTHSEFSAWKAAKGLLNPNKSFDMVNIRLNTAGDERNSMPCKCCYAFLSEVGCNSVHFSTNCGFAKLNIAS
jgi:hypothetical protein